MLGVILYRGPSALDGKPIVVVATLRSSNRKTGGMIQTWILREDMAPLAAIRAGEDRSICGDCVHRGRSGDGRDRSCYVNVGQAPSSVWKAFGRGRYVDFDPNKHLTLFEGRVVRLGAYGDPAAVPYSVWEPIVRSVPSWTGYTHQWRTADVRFRGLCMASVDTEQELNEARAAGWRAFRVKSGTDPVLAGEIVCPASEEAGYRRTCETCRACSGTRFDTAPQRAATIVITVHGSAAHKKNHRDRN